MENRRNGKTGIFRSKLSRGCRREIEKTKGRIDKEEGDGQLLILLDRKGFFVYKAI